MDLIVIMWLDYAEDLAKRRKQVFLRDWETKLNEVLKFNERCVLNDAGRASKENADPAAAEQCEHFAAGLRTFLESESERDDISPETVRIMKSG